MNYSQKEQKFINSLQVLEFLFKLQKLRLCPEITIFDGDFIIHFDDIHGRDMTESVIITKESIWNGYGWSFDELISALDKKIEVCDGEEYEYFHISYRKDALF